MLLHFSGASAWAATSDALHRCHEHGASMPDFSERMGDYYAAFVRNEARALGFALEELRGWQPVVVAKKRGRKPKAG